MAVTIKDIAKAVGVSHSTVSRALTGSKYVNEKTKEEIFKAIKELNYTPNMNARSLKTDKTYNIGIFFSTIDNGTSPFVFQSVINNVYRNIDKKYNVIVKGIDTYEKNTINPKNYDGIIVVSQKSDDDDFIEEILEKEIPLVVINRKVDFNVVNVFTDENIGTFKGIEELIKNGHKEIAIIEGIENFDSTKMRRTGYIKAFKNYNININKDLVVSSDFTVKGGYISTKELLNKEKNFTAIFAFNDEMAAGAMKAIIEKRLNVPEDISILGFDGNELGEFLSPRITTIRRPIGEIAKIAINLLIKLIDYGDYKDDKNIYVESQLIIGDSIKNLIL